MDDPGRLRVGRVHPVNSQKGPHGRQAPEGFPAGELVAAVHALGPRRREQNRKVVARLGVTGREDLAFAGGLEDPVARRVSGLLHLGRDAAPVGVHVDGQGRRGGVVGEPAGLTRGLGQRHAQAAVLARDGHFQVAGLAQVLEVLAEEAVLAVVHGRALVKAPQKLIGEDRPGVVHRVCSFL